MTICTIKKTFINLITLLLLMQFMPTSAPVPSGRRLRDIVAEKFPDTNFILGATIGAVGLDTILGDILNREFSYVTPENDFKQTVIHPKPGVWNFTNAEKWVKSISSNGQIARIHAPIGPQCSDWAKDDARSAEELSGNLQEFFTAVCSLSNNIPRFKYLDVVNETVIKGEWHREKTGLLWECPWYILGQEDDKYKTPVYIKRAFEIANRYAKNQKFIFNQHQIFDSPLTEELIFETIRNLRLQGLRVDGIGWQAHIDNGWATDDNLNALGTFIDKCQTEKLEFHITEISVYIKEPLSTAQLQVQADTYSRILSVLLQKTKSGKIGWNTWALTDVYTAHAEWYPSLFDTVGKPKPAYYEIQRVLETYRPETKTCNVHSTIVKTAVVLKKYDNREGRFFLTVSPEVTGLQCRILNLQGCQIACKDFSFSESGINSIEWKIDGRRLPTNFVMKFIYNNVQYAQLVVTP